MTASNAHKVAIVHPTICPICGEAPHTIRECPACKSKDEITAALLRCRSLIRQMLHALYLEQLGQEDEIVKAMKRELEWFTDKD